MSLFVASRLYNLPTEEAKLIQDYLDRVRSYVTRHGLSSELIEDLEGNLAEKLDSIIAQSSHTIKDILGAIESLGEPEEVFAFEETTRSAGSQKQPGAKEQLQGFFARPWRRDRTNGVLLGVCAGIARELEINALWVRIAFVLLTFASGFGIIFYILLSFLMEKDTTSISTDIKGLSDKITPKVQAGIAEGSARAWVFVSTFASNLWEIIVRVANVIAGFWVLCASIGLVAVIWLANSNFSVANIDFTNIVPQTGYIAAIAGLVTLFMLTVCFFGRAAGRKTWTIISIAAVLAGFLISVGLTTRAVTEGVSKFNTQWTKQFTQTLTGVTTGEYEVDFQHTEGFSLDRPNIRIVTAANAATGSILVTNDVSAWGSSVESVNQSLSVFLPTQAKLEGNRLIIRRTSSNYFSQKSAFVFPQEHIVITVPANIIMHEEGYAYGQEQERRYQENLKKRKNIRNSSSYYEQPEEEDVEGSSEPEITVQPPTTPTTPTIKSLSWTSQR